MYSLRSKSPYRLKFSCLDLILIHWAPVPVTDQMPKDTGHREVDAIASRSSYRGKRETSVAKSSTTLNSAAASAEPDWPNLVSRIHLDRDRAAFAKIFSHFAPRVKAFLMKGGSGEALAEECTQEVMATLWQKAHLFDPARASVATWIFTIARNKKIDALRKQRRPEPEDLPWGPEEEPDQMDVVAMQQESERLAKAVQELPEKQRLLIQQAYFGELSHSEIAEETGLPLGTIKSRIRLALERLRHSMK